MSMHRNSYSTLLVCCLVAAFLSACSPVLATTNTPEPPSTVSPTTTATTTLTSTPSISTRGRILYVVFRGASSDIYVMNADGSGVTKLTDNTQYDNYPA